MGNFDQSNISGIYAPPELLPEPLPPDPMALVSAWLDEATRRKVQPNPNAIALATVGQDGRPQCRIVLCKGLSVERGWLTFFTNYTSRKGDALASHAFAAATMHWDTLDRQVRIEGPVERVSGSESDAYYATRPVESRLGAWASDQSRPIPSRKAMLEKVEDTAARLGLTPEMIVANEGSIARPPHWGGYRLWAARVELWMAGPGRVHDRAVWTRSVTPFASEMKCGAWEATRLQP